MDDDLQQLEAELKALRPSAPSAGLTLRIERDLANDRRTRGNVRVLWEWALPAAAALAIVATSVVMREAAPRSDETNAPPARSGSLIPVAAEKVLYAASDEGLVTLADGTRARRARLNYVDTFIWENPRTHASLKWSVPREEVRVIPVVFQ